MLHTFIDVTAFKDTRLYRFLRSNVQGKIILGKYQNTKNLDYARLKELIICKQLEDSVDFK